VRIKVTRNIITAATSHHSDGRCSINQ